MIINIDFNPELFSVGSLHVRWYGVMYVLGFFLGGKILRSLCQRNFLTLSSELAESLVTYLLLGMLVFARLFYVAVYGRDEVNSLIDVIAVWNGGLSFHGAAIGFIIAVILFARKHQIPFRMVIDAVVIGTPQGLFWGRLGNFINMELLGRPTDGTWGFIFANDPLGLTRHPSQLYQAFTEGIILSAIMFYTLKRVKSYGICGGVFLMAYGMLRFLTEFFRTPDAQMGLYLGETLTMGQILCLVMVASGVAWLYFIARNPLTGSFKSISWRK